MMPPIPRVTDDVIASLLLEISKKFDSWKWLAWNYLHLSLFFSWLVICHHFMAIWCPRWESEFRRISEKSFWRYGLSSNLKFTFFWKTWSKRTFCPISVLKTSNLRKKWILKILFNPYLPTGIIWCYLYHVPLMTS